MNVVNNRLQLFKNYFLAILISNQIFVYRYDTQCIRARDE